MGGQALRDDAGANAGARVLDEAACKTSGEGETGDRAARGSSAPASASRTRAPSRARRFASCERASQVSSTASCTSRTARPSSCSSASTRPATAISIAPSERRGSTWPPIDPSEASEGDMPTRPLTDLDRELRENPDYEAALEEAHTVRGDRPTAHRVPARAGTVPGRARKTLRRLTTGDRPPRTRRTRAPARDAPPCRSRTRRRPRSRLLVSHPQAAEAPRDAVKE